MCYGIYLLPNKYIWAYLFKMIFYFFFSRLLGVDKLFSYAINEWLNDIKKNQLPGLLGGVGPIHSLVQLG